MLCLYRDLLDYIKSFLSYKERIHFITTCKVTSCLKIDSFLSYTIYKIGYPKRNDVSYIFFYNPYFFINQIQHATHCSNFLGHNYINIIIYDSPITYYNIRIMKTYTEGKTIQDYLKEYQSKQYFINKITKYIDIGL
jgi:hypothetical protein